MHPYNRIQPKKKEIYNVRKAILFYPDNIVILDFECRSEYEEKQHGLFLMDKLKEMMKENADKYGKLLSNVHAWDTHCLQPVKKYYESKIYYS
ncbi:unnamed protein product [Schistosoma turkestanicum]|nr:unnamed protein product [Schistosoma turkestanicum]